MIRRESENARDKIGMQVDIQGEKRVQRTGWERMLYKVGAGLLIVLLKVACIDRL